MQPLETQVTGTVICTAPPVPALPFAVHLNSRLSGKGLWGRRWCPGPLSDTIHGRMTVLDPPGTWYERRGVSPATVPYPSGGWGAVFHHFCLDISPLLLTPLFVSLSYRIPFKIGQPKKQIVPKTVSSPILSFRDSVLSHTAFAESQSFDPTPYGAGEAEPGPYHSGLCTSRTSHGRGLARTSCPGTLSFFSSAWVGGRGGFLRREGTHCS